MYYKITSKNKFCKCIDTIGSLQIQPTPRSSTCYDYDNLLKSTTKPEGMLTQTLQTLQIYAANFMQHLQTYG